MKPAPCVELVALNQSIRIKLTILDVIIVVINPQSVRPFVFPHPATHVVGSVAG